MLLKDIISKFPKLVGFLDDIPLYKSPCNKVSEVVLPFKNNCLFAHSIGDAKDMHKRGLYVLLGEGLRRDPRSWTPFAPRY